MFALGLSAPGNPGQWRRAAASVGGQAPGGAQPGLRAPSPDSYIRIRRTLIYAPRRRGRMRCV
jgi:hypothetical protein